MWVLEAGYAITQTVTGWGGVRWRGRAAQLRSASGPSHLCPAQLWQVASLSLASYSFFPPSLSALSVKNQTSAQCLLLTVCPSSDFLTANTFISLGDISIAVCFVVPGQFIYLFGFELPCLILFLDPKLSDFYSFHCQVSRVSPCWPAPVPVHKSCCGCCISARQG